MRKLPPHPMWEETTIITARSDWEMAATCKCYTLLQPPKPMKCHHHYLPAQRTQFLILFISKSKSQKKASNRGNFCPMPEWLQRRQGFGKTGFTVSEFSPNIERLVKRWEEAMSVASVYLLLKCKFIIGRTWRMYYFINLNTVGMALL